MKNPYKQHEIWLITGSQHLYGEDVLIQVRQHAKAITDGLNQSVNIPLLIESKGVVTTDGEIRRIIREANMSSRCAGVILWMHTFSPAKMWIVGLKELQKPMVHLHTQYYAEIPWQSIDMDYMNLHQSAHGGREFGHVVTRLKKPRYVITGHWQSENLKQELANWVRTVMGYTEAQQMKVARFGDNMRNVAVTDGDKVTAQEKFGFVVDGFGIGDLTEVILQVSETEKDELVETYFDLYTVDNKCRKGEKYHESLRNEAGIEIGLRYFLEQGGYTAFTDTFEDLHGLPQLPGLAIQRLMSEGYGFGGEGDWKTAALLRIAKVIGSGLNGGTSFMEDYTYHFSPDGDKVLGAHMLEVCPSIASGIPSISVQPLGIGGKDDPVRMIFTATAGDAINASLIDIGHRFRLVVNDVRTVQPKQTLPNLPVASALWEPMPDLATAATAWIYAGAAHHSVYSQSVTAEHLAILTEMWDIEMLHINAETTLRQIKNELRWNEVSY